jgi:hypothetical protein
MIKLQNGTEIDPKPETEIACEIHNLKVKWGELDPYQQLAVEEGLDTKAECPCLLTPKI